MQSPTAPLLLDAAQITSLFTPEVAIEYQREAFLGLGRGVALQPERIIMTDDSSDTFCYAAKVSPQSGSVCKFGAVVPGNAALGLPTISATILVLDAERGTLAAILDGTTVTTLRTAAASAVAAEALSHKETHTLAMIGTGVQAAAHIRLLPHALPIEQVRLYGTNTAARDLLCATLKSEISCPVSGFDSAAAALDGAELVVTCTTSPTPVIRSEDVADGATVISVGSFAADRSELPIELFGRAARVVVDHKQVALVHAGSVRAAIEAQVLDADSIVELGDVVAGNTSG